MPSEFDEIEITDDKDRLFKAWGSVEIVDKDGELIPMEAFAKIMPKIMERGGVLIDNHTNRVVGKILNYEFRKKDGKDGLLLTGKVFNHFSLDDKIWNEIKAGIRKGISFGGKRIMSEIEKAKDDNGNDYYILKDIEGYEFSIVQNPANPEATIETVNMLAKSDSSEDDNKSAPSALRDIERGKEYGRPLNKDEPDVHVSISHVKNKWVVRDEKTGKVLGEHKTKNDAINQLQAVYVNADKSEDEPKIEEHDITEDRHIDEDQPDVEIEKIVKPLPNGKGWGVYHCHGKDKGKLIRAFKTKEEAERMHRAIMAHEYGGKNMNKDDDKETPAPEGAEDVTDTPDDDETQDVGKILSAIVDRLDALESKIDSMSKANDNPPKDDTPKDDVPKDDDTNDESDDEDNDKVTKSVPTIDTSKLTEDITKAVLDKLGIQSVETPRPEAPAQKPNPEQPSDKDLALKVARGEMKVTFDDIEHMKRESIRKKIEQVLED